MNRLLIFNVAIIVASIIMTIFVLTLREMSHDYYKGCKPNILNQPNHPFSMVWLLGYTALPLFSVFFVSTMIGLGYVYFEYDFINFAIPSIVMFLYFYTQTIFVDKMARVSEL